MLYSKAYFGVGYPKKPETSWRTTANLVSICGLEECDIAWQARASTLLLQHRRSYLANSNEGLRVSLAITNKTLRLEVNDIPFTLDPRMPTGYHSNVAILGFVLPSVRPLDNKNVIAPLIFFMKGPVGDLLCA
jgi:hypothetical protein